MTDWAMTECVTGGEDQRETGFEGGQEEEQGRCIDDLSDDEGLTIHLRPPVTPLGNSAERLEWQIHKYKYTSQIQIPKYTNTEIH